MSSQEVYDGGHGDIDASCLIASFKSCSVARRLGSSSFFAKKLGPWFGKLRWGRASVLRSG